MENLYDDLNRKKAALDKQRPLTRGSLEALNAWYDVELTYTSNAIEGNALTRNETADILEKGIIVAGKPLKDHLDAVGHKEALDYVRELADRKEPVREGDVRQIHQLIVGRVDPSDAGQYSHHQRQILGSLLVLPSPAQIPPLMGEFGQWLVRETATAPAPDTAFDAHEKLVTIHPFSDGNGRTARLLMNLLLIKGGFPPVVIGPEHRVAYLDGLQALQIGKDPKAYKQFMAERLDASLDRHIEALRLGQDQRLNRSLNFEP